MHAALRTSRPVSIASGLNPGAMGKTLWAHRELIARFTGREVAQRHRGSVLGMLWGLFTPLVMLGVYTFVFSLVWQARWDEGAEPMSFALAVFTGLVVFDIFAGSVNAAPMLIVNHPQFVRKVVFPLEVLPLSSVLTCVVYSGLSLVVLLAGIVLAGPGLSWHAVLLPVVVAPLVLLAIGAAWFLSALGVFLRDIRQVISGLVVPVIFFMTPIFYPLSKVPEEYRAVLRYNPIGIVVENARGVLLEHRAPDWPALAAVLAVSMGALQLGWAFFAKSKRGFADVV